MGKVLIRNIFSRKLKTIRQRRKEIEAAKTGERNGKFVIGISVNDRNASCNTCEKSSNASCNTCEKSSNASCNTCEKSSNVSCNTCEKSSNEAQFEVDIKIFVSQKDMRANSTQSNDVQINRLCCECYQNLYPDIHHTETAEITSFGDSENLRLCIAKNEIESWKAFNDCPKNPHHTNSTPAEELQLTSLPEDILKTPYSQEIYHCIQLMILLSVKLETFAMNGFSPAIKNGSGSLYISDEKCNELPSSNDNLRRVWVTTARHVVQNNEEAKTTQVTVEMDGKVTVLNGHRLVNFDVSADRCILECVTENIQLCERVLELREKVRELEQSLKRKFSKICPNLAVVISYPHGVAKRVSFGKIKEKVVVDNPSSGVQKTSFKHNVPTCPGSSGAVLWVLGFERIGYMDMGITDHTHSKGAAGNANESGQGLESDFPEIQGMVVSHQTC